MNGTMTTRGFIEYYRYKGINCPVALKPTYNHTALHRLRPPKEESGFLVYVLPGGREFVPGVRL